MNRGRGRVDSGPFPAPTCFNEAPIHESGKAWESSDVLRELLRLQ